MTRMTQIFTDLLSLIRVNPRNQCHPCSILFLSRKNNNAGNTVIDAVEEKNMVNAMSQPKRCIGGMDANIRTKKPNPRAAAF